MSPVAPAVNHIGCADCRHIPNPPVLERHPVEMTAVFSGESAHEGRPPDRCEAVALRQGRQAIESRVDEDEPSARLFGDVMHVEVAGRVADAGDVELIASLMK